MQRRSIHACLSGLAVLARAASAAVETVVAAPADNGRIVFRRYLDVDKTTGAIFTFNPDGTDARPRDPHPGRGINDTEADWAADGTRIAFVRQSPCPPDGKKNGLNGTCDVVYTAPDSRRRQAPLGARAMRVRRRSRSSQGNCVGVSHPGWSPDGSRLAFQYNLVDPRYTQSLNVNAGIWIANTDGLSGAKQVTQRRPGRGRGTSGRSGRPTAPEARLLPPGI